MDYHTLCVVLLPFILTIIYLSYKPSNKYKLPPGPRAWPIIGNLHLLGDKPHRSITELSKIYGPLMTLKLGSFTTIVVSSAEVAKEMFDKHDLALSSSRPIPDAVNAKNHGELSMEWLPLNSKWRHLRKIMTIQLFTSQRLDASQDLRRKKVNELVEFARECSKKGQAIDIGKSAFTTALNLLSNTFLSMDLASHDSSYSQEFRDLVWNLMEVGGKPNVSDYFPALSLLDLQGMRRKSGVYYSKMISTFEQIIDQRLKDDPKTEGDVLDYLLKLVKNNELSLDDVNHLLVVSFQAGTDTTTNVLEWAMTELLRHPQKMQKAQSEIDQLVGKEGLVQETDIPKLRYIQAVVKETFRVHPAGAFLLPRKATQDVQLCGYDVPKDSRIWVNLWAMSFDPSVWMNPYSFEPERFLENEIDIKGKHIELMPFGTGRRICPALPLAYRLVHLVLATLLHSFDWKLGNGMKPEDVDVEEKFGITLQKVQPLLAIPLAR